VFHMDVAKVDRDVAYVAMVVYVYYKLLFSMFHLFSDVCCKCVLSRCCICFTHMLASVLQDVAYVSAMVLSVFRCFCKCFRFMFQVFHLPSKYIASVASECFKSRSDVASPSSPSVASFWCLLLP
jgi:hypothetical protein